MEEKEDIEQLKNYEILEKLGQGGFGSVYKIKNKANNKIYALKQISLTGADENEIKSVKNEANILSKIKHKNIVNYCGSYSDAQYFNIFMEYCDGSDLRKIINDFKTYKHPIPKYLINYIMKEITNGIKELHNNKLIHRDLKPDNILITKDFKVKIGDFGLSKQLNSVSQYVKTQLGTLHYMAPEIIQENLYNNKVDIWALGCILYELCTLNICFKAVSLQKVIDKIIAGEPDKINISLYGTDFENLINLLIKKDYKQRPNINELYNKLNENDSNDNEKNQNDEINLREKYDSIIERNKNLTFDYINKDYDEEEYSPPYHNFRAVVVDLGTRFIRYNFAGEEHPYLIPTCIGFPKSEEKDILFIGKDAEELNNDLDLIYPIKNGIFYDWDNLEKLLGFIFEKELKIDPKNHLIILTESPFNTKENREKLVELIFEKFNFPALIIENKAVLNCYRTCKDIGLNINISESGTYIVPVFDNFKLDQSKIKYDIGGQALTEYMAKLLSEINPKFLNNSFKSTVEDIKNKVCYCCWDTKDYNDCLKDFDNPIDYELPDGCQITIKEPRIKCPEIFFQPSLIYKIGDNLPLSCVNSIEKCDKDIRELLLENIILTGGSSKIKNLKERLCSEMKDYLPSDMREKINIESKGATDCWGMASIIGSIGTYNKIIYSSDYLDTEIHRYFF